MSAQLILYTQIYNGTYTFTGSPTIQYVADGNFSNGLTATTDTTNSQPSHYAVTNSVAISAWKGYRSTGGAFASCSTPSISASGLTLSSNAGSASSTGVYQLISNLTVGQCYEVKINITSGNASGVLGVGNAFANSWVVSNVNYYNLGSTFTGLIPSATTLTYTRTAHYTEEVLLLDYRADNGTSIVIDNISITECPPATTPFDFSDGQVICDLYEEESIPLSLSIDDFKNVAEKTQSYSKDFHLPNTKRNNKIFGHIFEVSRATDVFSFNPYVKTRAILKEDSYTLFEGFLQLIDIIDKKGEISYNVNLFSEAVTLKDVLENKSFADIDFTELQHDYTITNVQNSWDDSTGLDLDQNLTTISAAYEAALGLGNTNVLKYPFVNWRGDWSIDPSGNIGLIDLEQVFRPFIQIRYLVKRIIHEAGFEFVSDFFETANFKKLFMDFNWGQGVGSSEVFESFLSNNENETIIYASTTALSSASATQIEIGTPYSENPTGIAGVYLSGNILTATNDNTSVALTYDITLSNIDTSSRTFEIEWQFYDDSLGTTTSIDNASGSIDEFEVSLFNINATIADNVYNYLGSINLTMDTDDTLKCVFKSNVTNKIFQGNDSLVIFTDLGTYFPRQVVLSEFSYSLTAIQSAASSLLHAIRGEINQWEFLKGIFTMFNLVVLKEEHALRIEPYSDIFLTNANTTQHNWTDKVDISEIKLKPLELKRMVKFAYEDDGEDYSLNVYKKATSGYLYGTLNFDGSTAMPNTPQVSNLVGEEEIIATPFAPTLLRPASDLFDAELTIPQIYSGNEDGTEFEDFENKPRILYNLGVKTLPSKTYFVPAQNGAAAINAETEFLQFAHLTEIPTTTTTVDYNFGACQLLPPIGSAPVDNLFQVYYSPYYDELYHPDTRVMTLKVNLSPADIENFKFYDTVVIKSREYRVNKIEYKPNTLAKVEFILIP